MRRCSSNARTDDYLAGLAQGDAAVAMTIERLRLYRDAGADGGFVPGLADAEAARRIADAVTLAVSVMALPGLPPVAALADAGIRRISLGPVLFKTAYGHADRAACAFLAAILRRRCAVHESRAQGALHRWTVKRPGAEVRR